MSVRVCGGCVCVFACVWCLCVCECQCVCVCACVRFIATDINFILRENTLPECDSPYSALDRR